MLFKDVWCDDCKLAAIFLSAFDGELRDQRKDMRFLCRVVLSSSLAGYGLDELEVDLDQLIRKHTS